MSPHPKEHPERSDLVRGLGLWAATAVVIGDTIGSGIFLVSSDMARASGSATLVFAAWILGGLIVLFGAFCYAELGAAFPKAGGPYLYLNRGLGPLWGFLFPVVATPLFTGHVGRYAFTFTAAQPLAALVVLLLTAINYLSVQVSGAIQVLLTSLKVGAIVLIVVGGILLGTKHSQAAQLDIPSVSAPLAMGPSASC